MLPCDKIIAMEVTYMHVIFKDFVGLDAEGQEVVLSVARADESELLRKIQEAPRKTPISFQDAMRLAWKHEQELSKRGEFKAAVDFIFKSCLVTFWSGLGFHVELTGNEYSVQESQAAL
jgi:hypothetical protein